MSKRKPHNMRARLERACCRRVNFCLSAASFLFNSITTLLVW